MNYQQLMNTTRHISDNEGLFKTPTGQVKSIYGDSNGNITTGVGINVNSRDNFIQQPFRNADTQDTLSSAEKAQAYDAYQTARQKDPSLTPQNFMQFDSIEYPPNLRDSGVMDRVLSDEPKIRAALGTDADGNSVYDKLTDGQKTVMHDVYYANGSFQNFPKLIDKAKNADAKGIANESSFMGGAGQYNYDRLARNRAAAQGISFEDAQKDVATQHAKDQNLPPNYKALIPKSTSDSGDTSSQQTASGDQPTAQQEQQTAAASSTDDTEASAYPPVDDQTAQRLASLPDLPPAGTPITQAFADISNDDTPVPFAAMSQALTDMGGEPPPPSLLGGDGATGAFA